MYYAAALSMNEELKDLAQSIHDMGVLTPVIDRPTDDGYEFLKDATVPQHIRRNEQSVE